MQKQNGQIAHAIHQDRDTQEMLSNLAIRHAQVCKLGATMDLMSKPAIHVSEAEAANNFPSLLARVRAGTGGDRTRYRGRGGHSPGRATRPSALQSFV
jgi:hypothetical protein